MGKVSGLSFDPTISEPSTNHHLSLFQDSFQRARCSIYQLFALGSEEGFKFFTVLGYGGAVIEKRKLTKQGAKKASMAKAYTGWATMTFETPAENVHNVSFWPHEMNENRELYMTPRRLCFPSALHSLQ